MIAAIVLAAYAGTVDLSDTSSVTARAMSGTPPGLDLTVVPYAAARISDRRWDLTLSYSPFVYITDIERGSGASPLVFNNGSLLAAWHNRRVRLYAGEDASYGQMNSAYLALPAMPSVTTTEKTPPVGVQLIPQQAVVITTVTSRTTVGADLRLSRRLTLQMRTGYFLYGGADSESQQIIPRGSGPFANASAGYTFSHTDALLLSVAANGSDTQRAPCQAFLYSPAAASSFAAGATCAPEDVVGSATLGLSHNFSRASIGTLAVGGGLLTSQLNATGANLNVVEGYPSGVASYQYTFGYEARPMVLHLDLQLGPLIDFRTGLADYRVQGNLLFTYRTGRLTLSELVATSRSFGDLLLPPATIVVATTTAEYRLTRNVFLTGFVNYFVEDQNGFGTFTSAIATLSLVLHASPIHF